MNSFAKAWLDAANDLGIRVIHPVLFQTNNGVKAESVGVLLPDFGSKNGTLLTCRFDTDEVMNLADDTDYYQSGLNPHCYEPYDKEEYIETLNDWGWFGSPDDAPEWFSGGFGKHGGSQQIAGD